MVKKIKKYLALLILVFAILFFYTPFFVSSKLPIPADTIIGLYHPFRDLYSGNYPNGIPYKNFLITDPVRQTFVWKELVVNIYKTGNIPLWNPYEMTGKPLLGNFQSAVFYPLNLLLFIVPFSMSWSLFIVLQSLLFGVFMFVYLRNLKVSIYASLLSGVAITFSGFSIAWLEWGNIVSTALWLPLILLAVDKITSKKRTGRITLWCLALFVALVCSFLAGHLQSFAYLFILSISYFFLRWFENKNVKSLLLYILINVAFILVTFVQWFPTIQFILLSNRIADQNFSSIEGWFIPWRHLIQFIAPDFFGNPSTLNYWGTWNYGELVGYIGIIPFIFALYAFYKRTRTTLFYSIIILICLLMALPTGISSLPFIFKIPFVSTAQPTRLLFPIIFSLSVMAALGMDQFMSFEKIKLKQFLPLFIVGGMFGLLLILIFSNSSLLFNNNTESVVAKRNIVFPLLVFFMSAILLFLIAKVRNVKLRTIFISILVLVSFVDLFRFAQKFTPFTSQEYLFPSTKTLSFLSDQKGLFRVAVMDRRIMPPNFFTHYKIQTIEGYDPLYIRRYSEYIVSLERNKPDLNAPFGFNRIITPHNFDSPLFDLLNAKYVLSLDDIKSKKLVKVFEEGQTKVYENKMVLPRLFFVKKVVPSSQGTNSLFQNDLAKTAIVDSTTITNSNLSVGLVSEISYYPNIVSLRTENSGNGYLVFSDAYYPTWTAYIDGIKTEIYVTNHAFRGIFVPKGTHHVQFKDNLF